MLHVAMNAGVVVAAEFIVTLSLLLLCSPLRQLPFAIIEACSVRNGIGVAVDTFRRNVHLIFGWQQ